MLRKKAIKTVAMLCAAVLILQLLPAGFAPSASAYTHTGGMYTEAQINFVKEKVQQNAYPWKLGYEQLMEDADRWMGEVPSAPEVWYCPGWYDNEAGHLAAKAVLMDDVKAAYACALAYKFTGVVSYADKAKDIINNWAYTNVDVTGADGDLVLAYVGNGFITAAEMIRNYPGWQAADKAQFNSWLTGVFIPSTTMGGHANTTDWEIYGKLLAYNFLDDTANFTSLVNRLKGEIDYQIDAQGSLPAENIRAGNSMWYTYFALAPMTAACQVVYNVTGEDLFNWISPGGKTIKTAVQYFYYYCEHPDEWPWYSGAAFPGSYDSKTWPLPLYEAMAGVFNNQDYYNYVQSYRPLFGPFNNGVYHHIAWFYPTLMYGTLQLNGAIPAPIEPPVAPMPAVSTFEAESLPIMFVSPSVTAVNDSNASGGKTRLLNAGTSGHYVEFTVPVTEAGTFNVKVRVRRTPSFGSYRLSVQGVEQGTFDCYSAASGYYEFDLGDVTFDKAGTGKKAFRFTCTGKNTSSAGYKLQIDSIKLTKVSGVPGIPTSGLAAYWSMDEGSGSTAADSSGNGNNGTLSGPVWTAGNRGGALSFDGTNDYVNAGNPAGLKLTGAMTLSAWIKIDTVSGNGRIISKQGYTGSRGWSLNVEASGVGAFQIASNSSSLVTVNTSAALPTGQWVHLAGVYEPGTALRIYVNGVLSNSNSVSVPAAQYNSNLNVWIGARPSSECYFDGDIDEVRVYNRALSDSEIAALAD